MRSGRGGFVLLEPEEEAAEVAGLGAFAAGELGPIGPGDQESGVGGDGRDEIAEHLVVDLALAVVECCIGGIVDLEEDKVGLGVGGEVGLDQDLFGELVARGDFFCIGKIGGCGGFGEENEEAFILLFRESGGLERIGEPRGVEGDAEAQNENDDRENSHGERIKGKRKS